MNLLFYKGATGWCSCSAPGCATTSKWLPKFGFFSRAYTYLAWVFETITINDLDNHDFCWHHRSLKLVCSCADKQKHINVIMTPESPWIWSQGCRIHEEGVLKIQRPRSFLEGIRKMNVNRGREEYVNEEEEQLWRKIKDRHGMYHGD